MKLQGNDLKALSGKGLRYFEADGEEPMMNLLILPTKSVLTGCGKQGKAPPGKVRLKGFMYHGKISGSNGSLTWKVSWDLPVT